MKGRKPNPYNQILEVLTQLHKLFPSYNMARHLDTALSDYDDIWDLSDKEMLFALQKYQANLEMDVAPNTSINKIIEDGMNLNSIFDEEEEDYLNED